MSGYRSRGWDPKRTDFHEVDYVPGHHVAEVEPNPGIVYTGDPAKRWALAHTAGIFSRKAAKSPWIATEGGWLPLDGPMDSHPQATAPHWFAIRWPAAVVGGPFVPEAETVVRRVR